MKYVIYKMVEPEHLQSKEMDGYYLKTITRHVLEELDIRGVETEHSTLESAITEISKQSENLKHLTLTVLPVISINYEGSLI